MKKSSPYEWRGRLGEYGKIGIFRQIKFCWSGEIGIHIVFRTLRA